jgi:hypothetical protein
MTPASNPWYSYDASYAHSVEIARLLFVAQKILDEERDRVRQDLLNYCERDTWAMVKCTANPLIH